ncbi:MAG: hypothetical protein JJD92_03210, partial [Frankiaceae bacterium]|nr:hypothetical protein [Frankiaceae bacterium]
IAGTINPDGTANTGEGTYIDQETGITMWLPAGSTNADGSTNNGMGGTLEPQSASYAATAESTSSTGVSVESADAPTEFNGAPRQVLAPDLELDPVFGLDPSVLEATVAFDPAMTVVGGLAGMTNLDGSAIQTGPSALGVTDPILGSTLDLGGDLLGDTVGTGPGAGDLSFRAPTIGLVSSEGDEQGDHVPSPDPDEVIPPTPPPPPMEEEEVIPPTPPPPTLLEEPAKLDPDEKSTDPDAVDVDDGVTGDDVERAVTVQSTNTTPVVDHSSGVVLDGGVAPIGYTDLVTNDGDGSTDTSTDTGTTGQVLVGPPDAPVINTINTDSGVMGPGPTSTDPGQAATAITAPDSEPVISLVGSGGSGGISTLAPSEDDVLGVEPLAEKDEPAPTRELAPASAVERDAPADLQQLDVSVNLVSTGLSSDLTADIAPLAELEPLELIDRDGGDLLEGSMPDIDGRDDLG